MDPGLQRQRLLFSTRYDDWGYCYLGLGIELQVLTKLEFQILYATRLLFVVALTSAKLSILHLYRRIFSNRTFHMAIWYMYAITLLWGVSFFFVNLFRCIPVSYAWRAMMSPHHCISLSANYANAVSTILTDLMILVSPMPLIWRLQMPTRQKIIVSAMFLLGALYVLSHRDCLLLCVELTFVQCHRHQHCTRSVFPQHRQPC